VHLLQGVFVCEDGNKLAAHDETEYTDEDVLDDIASVFSRDKIMAKLFHLKPDKSAGPDEFHPLLMKECASEISRPLQHILSETGSIPQER